MNYQNSGQHPYGYPQGIHPHHGHNQGQQYHPHHAPPYSNHPGMNMPPRGYPVPNMPPQGHPGYSAPHGPPYQQPHNIQQHIHSPPVWNPSPYETSILDGWFHSLDPSGTGIIQGAQAVGFLKRSNLHRDILRKIWSLVDTQNRGFIDKRQFGVVMRLVALSCMNPHAPVTMDRYYQTCHDSSIVLPPMAAGVDSCTSVSSGGSQHLGTSHSGSFPPPAGPHPSVQPGHAPYGNPVQTNPSQQMQVPQPHTGQPSGHVPPPVERLRVPSVIDMGVDDDAVSEFSDYTSQSTGIVNAASPYPSIPAQNTDDGFDDDMGDFQAPSGGGNTLDDDDMGDFQAPNGGGNAVEDDDMGDFQAPTIPDTASQSAVPAASDPGKNAFSSDMGDFQSVPAPAAPVSLSSPDSATKGKKSIQDMLAMVAADPLNTHAPTLKQWQQSHPSESSAGSTSKPVATAPEEIDLLVMDDSPVVTSPLGAKPQGHRANANMSVFDELVEQDLQEQAEEWDDFVEVTEPEPSTMNAVAPVEVESAYENPFDQFFTPSDVQPVEDDDFGGFESATVEISEQRSDGVNAMEPTASSFNQEDRERESDDFGGFQSSSTAPNELFYTTSESVEINATSANSAKLKEPFDSGNESFISPPADKTNNEVKENDEFDADFGEFEEASSSVPSNVSRVHDISVTKDVVLEPAGEELPVDDTNPRESDDFGDFADAIPMSNVMSAGDGDVIIETVVEHENAEGFNAPAASAEVSEENVDPVDDDFDDFEGPVSAPIAPSSPSPEPPLPKTESNDSDDPFAVLGPKAESTVLEDLVSDFEPMSNPVASTGSLVDLDMFYSPTESTPVATSGGSVAVTGGSVSLFDEFVPSTSKTTVSESDSDLLLAFSTVPLPSKQLPQPVDRNLTFDELENLCAVLFDLNLYTEAYCALRQAKTVRRIKELGNSKMQAVENDDLELAIQLRDEITRERENNLIAGREEEGQWLEAAHAGKKREALEDVVEFIESIDAVCGQRVRAIYLSLAPDESSPLMERLHFYVNAKRVLQTTIAVRTSHKEHVTHWKKMMTEISRILNDSMGSIQDFERLSESDQLVVRQSEPMKVFVEGLIRVVEVGKWISATCLETMVETAAAAKTLSLCDSVTVGLCALASPGQHCPTDSITQLASKSTELIGRKDVAACAITLRPVVPSQSKDNSNKIVSGTSLCEVLGLPYMQAAVSFWVANFPDSNPPSDPIMLT
mmetsp:Transcript_2861/g.4350  ORF Transcript_2861/g.4350 Transcript_2861/m.4350 type:complete len:1229 (-) Transcript_2861:84-3770(-)